MLQRFPAMTEADDTKRKLLEAAGAMFARDGCRIATVREICSEAGLRASAATMSPR